jgi:hypothetical protein
MCRHTRPWHCVADAVERSTTRRLGQQHEAAFYFRQSDHLERDGIGVEKQQGHFLAIEAACAPAGMSFSWEFDTTGTIHARHIVTDTGWKILLDRGLDLFQSCNMNDAFGPADLRATHQARRMQPSWTV